VGGNPGSGGTGGSGGGMTRSIFDVWREAQQALRTSPDHLVGRADALVAQADVVAMHTFVRDQIVTYPPSDDSMQGMVLSTRWGVRATLRGGAGTPREKCELLAHLYRRAGFEAEVVAGQLDKNKADGKTIVLRETKRVFAPEVDDATKAAWLAVLAQSAPAPGTALDPDLVQTTALASAIESLAPGTSSSFDFAVDEVPLVRVKVNGTWAYANPVVPDVTFGDSATTDVPHPVADAYSPQTIAIRVEGSRADAPYERFTLVEHTYQADEVAGRRIHVTFAPAVARDALPTTTFGEVSTFVPVLHVAGADVTAVERDSLAVIGNPVTLGGDVVQVADDGDVSIDGRNLGQGPSDAAAVARVATLNVRVRGEAFRRVDLSVSALDGSGNQVPNLRADAFRVLEDGNPVAATLWQNDAGPPRVILIHDVSASIPADYLGAGAVDFGMQVVTSLYQRHPMAQVRVGIVDFGVRYASGGWAGSLNEAQDQVAWLATQSGGSELYAAAAQAQDEEPTAIVLVSDGDSTDTLDPEYQAKLAAGGPVVAIGVGDQQMQSLDAIARLTGGSAHAVSDKSAAIDHALEFLDARTVEDYRISYVAPEGGNATRQVVVQFDQDRLRASAEYDVPATPAPRRALSSLYLTVRIGDREATRVIAGYEGAYTTAYTVIPQSAFDDVESLLFGRVTLAVEGAGVTPAQWLDDWLGEKLTLEPVYQALLSNDDGQMTAASRMGFHITPPKLFAMSAGLPANTSVDAITFERGPRVAALLQKVQFGKGIRRQIDLFSHSVWTTTAEDPTTAFRRTLRTTGYLAVAEGAMYARSTKSLLSGVALQSFVPGTISDLPTLDDAARSRWSALQAPFSSSEYALLAPSTGALFAFWAVHRPSGTFLGIMPDGSGGGIEDELNDNLERTNHLLDLIGDLGALAGADVGFWVELEKTLAAKLTAATIVISGGQADLGDWEAELGDAICDAISDGIKGPIPGLEEYENVQEVVDQVSFWSGMGGVKLPDVGPDICP